MLSVPCRRNLTEIFAYDSWSDWELPFLSEGWYTLTTVQRTTYVSTNQINMLSNFVNYMLKKLEQFLIIFKSEKIVLHNDDYKFMAQFRDTVRANFTQEILFNKVQWGKILANYFSKYFTNLKKIIVLESISNYYIIYNHVLYIVFWQIPLITRM